MRDAAETARDLDIFTVEEMTSLGSARTHLEKCLRGDLSLPDAIILDLDLGYESGHELLRFWHTNARLSTIPLIVWSRLGKDHQAVCEAFKITAFVSKYDGVLALRLAIQSL
jgi:DNA-binding response OmpR family regulator